MPEAFRASLLPRGDLQNLVVDFFSDVVHAGLQPKNFPRVYVHVVTHALICLRIRADLDDRRNSRAYNRPTTGSEQNHMRSTSDEFGDFCIVIDIGKTESRFAIRYDVEQVQASFSRDVAGLDETGDWRIATLAISANRLFLDGRQSTFGIPRREAGVTHLFVVISRFFYRFTQFVAERRRHRASRHYVFQADHLPGFFEDCGSAIFDKEVESPA